MEELLTAATTGILRHIAAEEVTKERERKEEERRRAEEERCVLSLQYTWGSECVDTGENPPLPRMLLLLSPVLASDHGSPSTLWPRAWVGVPRPHSPCEQQPLPSWSGRKVGGQESLSGGGCVACLMGSEGLSLPLSTAQIPTLEVRECVTLGFILKRYPCTFLLLPLG